MDDLKQYTVLVVDDNPSWRDLVCQVLEEYTVIAAASSADVFKAMLVHQIARFDVAIIDKNLSDKPGDDSGLVLAKEIKSRVPECRIIVLTGYADVPSARLAFKDVEVFDYLEKHPAGGQGFDNAKLRETVYKAILSGSQPPQRQLEASNVQGTKLAKVSILHLSDLHFGHKHRFAPPKYDPALPSKDVPSLSKVLAKDLEQQGASIDLMIISGDLAESGDMSQFTWARQDLEKLCGFLTLSKDQVIIVPGNHDIQWIRPEDKPLPEHEPIGNYRTFYELFYRRDPKDKDRLFHVAVNEKKQCAVMGLDSCVIEGAETAGIGYIGNRQLDDALTELHSLTKGCPNCIKVAVLHHHLLPVEPITHVPLSNKQFSLVMDASTVLRRLYQEDFAVVLHGHQHQPYYADFRLHEKFIARTSPMAVIGVGSAGAERSELGNIARNHYNIIEIELNQEDVEIRVMGRQSSSQSQVEFESYGEATFNLRSLRRMLA